jgi:cysteinyl-tRNA synthetase
VDYKSSNLRIYNTLDRKKEPFKSIKEGFVGIYVCGPTVYGHAHIGHAKSYVSFDVIVRYLRALGNKVRYVQNITDVGHLLGDTNEGEDRILKQAKVEQLEPMEIAERYTRSYFEDMDILNVQRPDISPRASGHIPEQIDLVKELLEKGYAYEKGGNVYFDVRKFKEYGKLSGRKVDELIDGVRVDVADDKKSSIDFALWKHAEPEHLMRWNSPWGVGYPGWHTECSVMSVKYLGQPFDIHGGGLENVFPHHECEIAQSEAATGEKFANYWIHNNMVTVDGVKMGKSLGNSIMIKDIVQKYKPLAVRFFILNSHYRSPLDFSDKALDAAQKGYEKLTQNVARIFKLQEKTVEGKDENFEQKIAEFEKQFYAEMDDDFNTPRAIAAVFNFLKEVNGWIDNNSVFANETVEKLVDVIKVTVDEILGLIIDGDTDETSSQADIDGIIRILLDLRNKFRAQKQFDLSDEIRDRLKEINIEIKDTKEGTFWEWVS